MENSRAVPPGSRQATRSEARGRIYGVVARIPAGRVATYGQVAALAGLGGQARQVGYALHDLPTGSSLPWHRVINAQGRVSPRAQPGWESFQRRLLEREGIRFENGRVDLERYRWEPPAIPVARPPGGPPP